MKKTYALIMAFSIIMQSVVFAEYPTSFGADGEYGKKLTLSADSCEDNIFYIDSHPFVLLDKDAEGNYFVIADEYYGKGGFSYTSSGDMTYPQKFDINGRTEPANRVNAAVYINSDEFLAALPWRISNKIIPYKWIMEAAGNFNGYSCYYQSGDYTISETYDAAYDITEPYVQECRISLPSRTELSLYQDLIGYNIKKSSTCLTYPGGGSDPSSWLIRTPFYFGEAGSRNDQAEKIKMSDGGRSTSRDMSNALRPIFFLDKDFFRTTKIDVINVGSKVKAELLESVGNDKQKLTELGYTFSDLIEMGLADEDESIVPENLRLSYTKSAPGYTLEVLYDYSGNEDKEGSVITWYTSSNNSDWSAMENGGSYTIKNADATKYIRASVRIKTTDERIGAEAFTESTLIGSALSSVPNSTVARFDNHMADTPAEYTMTLQNGTTLAFLDVQKTQNGFMFFATTNESSGQSIVKTAKFDPTDENSIAYALEEFMYKSQTTDTDWTNWSGSSNYSCSAIDSQIKKHMVLYEYETEASKGAGIENDYVSKAHISLMSYKEFEKYHERFGYYISSGNYWVLRSVRPDGKLMVVDNTTSDPTKNGRIGAGGVGGAYKIRPVFWVDGTFFTDVKLNVEATGSKVREEIVKNFTRDELISCGYNEDELALFGFETATAENATFGGAFEVGQKINISYTYKNSNTNAKKNQRYEWYRIKDGVGELIENENNDSYILRTEDEGCYIKAVIIPYTSFMTEGTKCELTSTVAVRKAPLYIAEVTDIGNAKNETVTATLTVNNLTESDGSVIVILSVFDKESRLVGIKTSEETLYSGENKITVTAPGGGVCSKVIVIDNKTAARPVYTASFGEVQSENNIAKSGALSVIKARIGDMYTAGGSVVGTGYKNEISLIILNENSDIVYADYVNTKDESFTADFYMPSGAISGDYRILAGTYDAQTAETAQFSHVSLSDKAVALAEIVYDINNLAAKETVVGKIEGAKNVLELSDSVSAPAGSENLRKAYGDLYDIIKEKGIISSLTAFLATSPGEAAIKEFIEKNAVIEAFCDLYYRCLSVYAFSSSDKNSIEAVISEFGEYYAFEKKECYPITQNNWFDMTAFYARIAGADCKNSDEITKLYNEQAFLEGIHSAKDYNEVIRIFDGYAQYVDIDLADYNRLGDTTVSREIVSESFKEIKELEEYIADIKKTSGSSSGGGSSGGGGGSSSGGISVSAGVFKEITPDKSYAAFNDLSGALWAAEAIESLYKMGIVSGYEDGSFKPEAELTREALVKMIVDAKNILNNSAECDFTDLPSDFWAYRYVASAVENNIVSGYEDSSFGIGNNITRQDMAVMLVRAAGIVADGGCDFADSDQISGYAKDSVAAMRQYGIINGYEDNTFRPGKSATRAEAAKIIYDMIERSLL